MLYNWPYFEVALFFSSACYLFGASCYLAAWFLKGRKTGLAIWRERITSCHFWCAYTHQSSALCFFFRYYVWVWVWVWVQLPDVRIGPSAYPPFWGPTCVAATRGYVGRTGHGEERRRSVFGSFLWLDAIEWIFWSGCVLVIRMIGLVWWAVEGSGKDEWRPAYLGLRHWGYGRLRRGKMRVILGVFTSKLGVCWSSIENLGTALKERGNGILVRYSGCSITTCTRN